MTNHLTRSRSCLAMLAMLAMSVSIAGQGSQPDLIAEIRKTLVELPSYGVFDYLVFSVNGPTVTIAGYAESAALKAEAEREVRRITGVGNVIDSVQLLTPSKEDDRIRQEVYRAIYSESLSRYAPGSGRTPDGSMRRFDRPFRGMSVGRFPVQEPVTSQPIHIIVSRGNVTLYGLVENGDDRMIAGFGARDVPGTFGVVNELQIEGSREIPHSIPRAFENLPNEDYYLRSAAGFAIVAESVRTGKTITLVSVHHAQQRIGAGVEYRARLVLLIDGTKETARIRVLRSVDEYDEQYSLTSWTWGT